jgi:hypothetical protein
MNQNTIRKMSDRKRPVIVIRDDEEPIVALMRVSQACRAVGWSQAEVNATMTSVVFDGLDSFIDSITICLE